MEKPKRIKLSNGRRLVDEVIRSGGKMTMATYARDFDLTELCKLRKRAKPRIDWNVIYMKAYAIIARDFPQLRQCYVGFPWPYAYQYEKNVALITLSREHDGEDRLLFARFNQPEGDSLVELQRKFDSLRRSPVLEVKQFRKQIRFANLPYPVRRLTWWMLFNLFPRKRLNIFGTFGMTISRFRDAHLTTNALGPNTTILGIDVLPTNGIARFTLTFDHQILDGAPVLNLIHSVYQTLTGAIADELAGLEGPRPRGP